MSFEPCKNNRQCGDNAINDTEWCAECRVRVQNGARWLPSLGRLVNKGEN